MVTVFGGVIFNEKMLSNNFGNSIDNAIPEIVWQRDVNT